MLNAMCAMRIVPNPCGILQFRKSARSDAPITISGVVIGTKISRLVVPDPWKRYRTRASAINVPNTVAMMLVNKAISMLTRSAPESPG
jgi:hypothetical protein